MGRFILRMQGRTVNEGPRRDPTYVVWSLNKFTTKATKLREGQEEGISSRPSGLFQTESAIEVLDYAIALAGQSFQALAI